MAKGRMLNKKISNSRRVNALPLEAELLYTWLIPHLDVNGIFYGDARMVKNLVFPRKNFTEKQVEQWLKLMEATKNDNGVPLIYRYEIDGDRYLWMPGFDDEQVGLRKDKEKPEFKTPPKFPTFSGKYPESSGQNPPTIAATVPENDGVTEQNKNRIGKEQEEEKNRTTTEGEGAAGACRSCSETENLTTDEIVEVTQQFEDNVCRITSAVAIELNDALQHYSKQDLLDAIKACALQNKHTMAYFLGVLRNMHTEQKPGGGDPDKFIKGNYAASVLRTPEEVQAFLEARKTKQDTI